MVKIGPRICDPHSSRQGLRNVLQIIGYYPVLIAIRRVVCVELDPRADCGSHGIVPLGNGQVQGAICESERLRKLTGLSIGFGNNIQHTRIRSRCKIVGPAGKCYGFSAVAECIVRGGCQNPRGADQGSDAVGLNSEHPVPQGKSFVLLAQSDVRIGQSLLCRAEARTESKCPFQFRYRLVRMALLQQESAQVVVTFHKHWINADGFAKLLECFLWGAQEIKVDSQIVVALCVVRIHFQGLSPDCQGLRVFLFIFKLHRLIDQLIDFDSGNLNFPDAVTCDVDEFRDVDGTVGGGCVVDEDGGAGVAVGVQVREIHLCVGRACLGGEDQPAAVGREAVPRIHDWGIGAQAAGCATTERNDVELTVRPHKLAVMALNKDNPAPVRRDLWEGVAHAILRGSDDALRRTSLAVVERNSIKIELNLSLVGIVRVESRLLSFFAGIPRHGSCKHDGLPVGAPDSVRLDVLRIISAGQWLTQARGAVVPLQDAPRWIEDLKKPVVLEVGDVVRAWNVEGWASKCADYESAVRGDLGHETYARLADLSVCVPLNDVLVLNRDVALDGHDGIEALVVGRTIDVDAHRLAVAGEGMAIGAGGHVVENGAAFRLANIAKTPLDEMDG